jgi:hypothetical protein
MKKRSIVAALLVACLGVSSSAAALTIHTHGADFTAFNAGQAQDIDYLSSGVRTLVAGTRSVILSVKRNPATAANQVFTISGVHNSVLTTNCTWTSFNTNGTPVASGSTSAAAVSGFWSRSITFSAAQVPGFVSVFCPVHPSGGSVLFGVTYTG